MPKKLAAEPNKSFDRSLGTVFPNLSFGLGCYFRRQPQTSDEIQQAVNAVWVSCVEALRYGGEDATVLARLRAKGCEHLSDAPSPTGEIGHVAGLERQPGGLAVGSDSQRWLGMVVLLGALYFVFAVAFAAFANWTH